MSMYDLNPDFFHAISNSGFDQRVWEACMPNPNGEGTLHNYMSAGMDQFMPGDMGHDSSGGYPQCQLVSQSSSSGTDRSTSHSDFQGMQIGATPMPGQEQLGQRLSLSSSSINKTRSKRPRTQKRGSRQSSSTSASTSQSSQSPAAIAVLPERDIRSVSLERNRVAAAKCRIRKKEWVDTLQVAAREGNLQSRELQGLVRSLEQEVAVLKGMLQDCSCHYHTSDT